MNKYKLKNIPLNDGQLKSSMKVNATEFRPVAFTPTTAPAAVVQEKPVVVAPKPVEVDKVAEKLKKFGQNSEDIAEVKALLKELFEHSKSRGANAINIDLFKKVGDLKLSKTAK